MRKVLKKNVYKTKSAIWSYNAKKRRVSLLVINSENMTNDLIEYRSYNKNFTKHRDRIKRLTA